VLADACGDVLCDVHADLDHHRSVFTLAGAAGGVQAGARALTRAAVATLDLSGHVGAHPRFGVVDVVPFVPLERLDGRVGLDGLRRAVEARDAFARWAAEELDLPCFLYGPRPDGTTRSLPDVRRGAFSRFRPDTGPPAPHPSAGAVAVGARPLLVAYNLWLEDADLTVARAVAAALREPAVRALGFDLASGVQVSCNLLDPFRVGPADVYDRVTALVRAEPGVGHRGVVRRAELVGLLPEAALDRIPAWRWTELDLSPDRTIEACLAGRVPPSTR
jgi:glutamate formiminotransferase / 5-formyltetrahydrofolate cyclo-ligase